MRIGIAGVNGRMGRRLVTAIDAYGADLVGGLDRTAIQADIPHFTSIAALAGACDVVIDFTHPTTAIPHAEALAEAHTRWVLGTTGLDRAAQDAVHAAARHIAIVQAANFSPAITLLLALAERVAQALPAAEYDAEISEMHHRDKIDAPSGTALALGAAVAAGRRVALHRRADIRVPGDIGFASLRGGLVVGEHTLSFTSGAEQLSLSHRAFDRAVFANGAVRAALWVQDKPPGLYSMHDVIG